VSYSVTVSVSFKREAKKLKKRHKSLSVDIEKLIDSLEADPTQGTALGQNCYKIRLNISAKRKGKRGGARVITHVRVVGEIVYLLSIYDKSDKENVSEAEIDAFLATLDEGREPTDAPPA
jgi:hypothetical protein